MRNLLLASVAIFVGHSQPLYAADQTYSAGAAVADSGNTLEEVVVTAQKRSERIQSVPIAITAITKEQLEAEKIEDKYDLGAQVPGLTINRSAGTVALPFLRGIGSTNVAAGDEPSVATYIDGFSQGPATSSALVFNNIESIEVLKGPQGTLYGRNATGGLISLTTPTPSSEFSAKASVGYGSYDTFESNDYFTGPFSDQVRADLAIHSSNQYDGVARNLLTGSRVGVDDGLALRSKVLVDVSDDITLTLGGDFSNLNGNIGGALSIWPGVVPIGALLGGQYSTAPRTLYSTRDPLFITREYGFNAKLQVNLGDVTLVSMSQYRHSYVPNTVDIGGTSANNVPFVIQPGVGGLALPTLFLSGAVRLPAFVTQEFQLLSNGDGPFTWVAGAFGQYSREGYDPSIAAISSTLTPLALTTAFSRTTAYAAYAQGTYAFDNGLSLTAGARFSDETKHVEGSQSAGGFILAADNKTASFDAFTYRFAVDYKVMPGLLLYAFTSKGFDSGTFNTSSIDNSPPVKPEVLYDYEIGFKSDLWEGIRINGGGYYYDYQDIRFLAQTPGGLSTLQNAAGATLYGLELSLEARPIHPLTLTGSVAWEHARYGNFEGAQVYVPAPVAGMRQVFIDASGSPIVQTPTLTANIGINYHLDLPSGGGQLSLASNFYYNSGYPFDLTGLVKQAPYATVGGSITWRTPDDRWSVMAWGKNLTNELYYNQVTESARAVRVEYGLPATFGVTLGLQI